MRGRAERPVGKVLVAATLVFLASPWGAEAVHGAWKRAPRGDAAAVAPAADARPAVDAPHDTAPPPPASPAEQIEPTAETSRATRSESGGTAAATAARWRVTHVVDGDTIDVVAPDGTRERIRVIGMDTPEQGSCGFTESSDAMTAIALDQEVTLSPGAVDDRDRYGRLLRYVDVNGVDAGLALIEQGLAVARYDSRDGYGRHPREDTYVAADAATAHLCSGAAAPAPVSAEVAPAPGEMWASCSQARAAGAAPVYRDDPGYGRHLDGDGDGVGCE